MAILILMDVGPRGRRGQWQAYAYFPVMKLLLAAEFAKINRAGREASTLRYNSVIWAHIFTKEFGHMSRFPFATAALALSLSVVFSVTAKADFERGLELYQRGDVTGAAEEWVVDAENGNVVAAFLLGHMHKSGNGVTKSDRLAFPYFLQAAQRGHPAAQLETARYYYFGNEEAEIDQDYVEAGLWFDKAALNFSGEAQYYLGIIHRNGQGVPRDRAEGFRWLLLASNKAYVPAFLELADIYARGDGVVEEPIKAAMYLDLARRYVDPSAGETVSDKQHELRHFIGSDAWAEGRIQAELWVRANEQP
jgi:uncharacterized protein